MKKKLCISFIIPFIDKTGGVAVVLEYYRQLTAMGHDVNIFYPLLPYGIYLGSRPTWKKLPAKLKRFLLNATRAERAIYHFSEKIPVKPVVKINNIFIPDADVIVATAWPTAYDVAKLSPKRGRKFYFVQDYEIWDGFVEKVDASYRLPLGVITIAPWLTEFMKEKFGRNDVTEIHNCIRLDKFYPPANKDFNHASILLMAHNLDLKGTKDAIDALTIVKERYPKLEINMFGMCERPEAPFDFEYHRNPPYEKLLSLYQDAAIFIFPSRKDGWGLTPIEAIACKCALVATCAGCIPIINDGRNLILAEIKNPQSIADGVITLLGNKALTENIASQGLKSAQGLDWSKSARALLDLLEA